MASAIVVVGALVLWGSVLAIPSSSPGGDPAPFSPLRFAAPVAVAALAYQSLMQPWLAREGARWASVHGSEYALDTGNPAATPEDVFNTIILPGAVALDADHLTYEVTWNSSNEPLTVDENYEQPFGNTVSVRVNYTWFPELFLVGPFTLTSTSTAQMVY